MQKIESPIWLFLLLPLALYGITVSHDIGLPDSAIIIEAMRTPVLSSSAVNHNLNNLVGFLVNQLPIHNIALKSNLVSVIYGVTAIGLFYLLLLNLKLPRGLSGLCAGILMVSHSMWWHGTQVENYALSAVFLIACLLLVIKDAGSADGAPRLRYLCGLFFLAGLSSFNHMQNGVLSVAALVYFGVTLRRRKGHVWRAGLFAVMAWAVGMLPFALVFVRDALGSGDWAATLGSATGGGFRQFMFTCRIGPALEKLGDWVFMQFPSPFLAFIPIGLAGLLRGGHGRGIAAFVLTVFLMNTAFFMGYETWDQFSFYLLSFVCLALMGALGAAWCMEKVLAWGRAGVLTLLVVSLLLPPFVYANISRWAANPDGYWGRRYHAASVAYRERYDLVGLYTDPMRHDRGTVTQWIQLLFEKLPPGAWLIDDVSGYYQIEYFQKYYAIRPDLRPMLIRPLGMEGWGLTPDGIVKEGLLTTNRLFIVGTNGPCERVVEGFKRHGRQSAVFSLSETRRVYELVGKP